MKLFQKILLGIFVFFLFLFLAVSVYLRFQGQQVIIKTLTQSLKQDVKIRSLAYSFPFGLKASDVSVGDFFNCQTIKAQINLLAPFNGQIHLAYVFIDRPFLRVDKQQVSIRSMKNFSTQTATEANPVQRIEKQKEPSSVQNFFPAVSINWLFIRQGTVEYRDKDDSRSTLWLDKVDLRVKSFELPLESNKVPYTFSAMFLKEKSFFSNTKIESAGWIDVVKKDMDSKVKVIDSTGKIGLNAHLVSKDDQMNVQGDVSAGKFLLGLQNAGQGPTSSLGGLVAGALSNFGVEVLAKFSFATRMDDFEIRNINLEGTIKTQESGVKSLQKK
ncbi:MAG: hypothetical protein HQL24_05755 [Candidatus Omnitrophica bacterium]|nr:hypothetical protein [Candidatus Omnitrophota bacterium]